MGDGYRPVRPVSPSSGTLAVGWIRPAALNPVNAFGSLQEYKLAEHASRRRAKPSMQDRFIIYLCFDLSLITIMYCIIQAYYLAADAERRVFPHMIVENTHCRN